MMETTHKGRERKKRGSDTTDGPADGVPNGTPMTAGQNASRNILVPTVTYKDVPLLFREPYVFTGYRVMNQRWLYYVCSIFQVHNECMNVWTHIAAFVYLMYKLSTYAQELDFIGDPYTWPLAAGISSGIGLYIISCCAHCLQSRSQLTHYTCFMVDYSGIGLYAFGSVISHYAYCMEEELYVYLRDIFIPVGFVLSLNCCLFCAISKTMYQRPYPFQRRLWQIVGVLSAYVWLILPVIHQVWNCYRNDVKCDDSISIHGQQIVLFIVAGFFFASDIPQRFVPGSCDFIGHSHQIFHIGIGLVSIKQFDACIVDLRNERDLLSRRPLPTFMNTFGVLGFLFALNIFCVFIFRRLVQRKLSLR